MKYGLGDKIVNLEVPYRDPHKHPFIAEIAIEVDMTTLRYDTVDGKREVVEFDWDVIEDIIIVDRYDDGFQFVLHPHNTQNGLHDLYRTEFMKEVDRLVADEYPEILNKIEQDITSEAW